MTVPTILVVEDNPITRKLLRVALRGEGYQVVEAADGASALELLGRHRPDLVLQDLMLPDFDGLELVQRFRAQPAGAAIPIVAITGLLSAAEQMRSVQVGFTDYLFKPVELSHLVATIRAYLSPEAAAGALPGRGRKLLVVDDDPIQLKLLTIQLEQLGFTVRTAANGQEALADGFAEVPDAVISDVLMPRLDGFRLCLAVRQHPRLSGVPVLLTSAVYTEHADGELARRVGACAFVLRSADGRELIAALLAALGQAPRSVSTADAELPVEEYTHRVIRQLEHQVNLSASLARRLGLLEAELGILGRVLETLKATGSTDTMLRELLYRCLDAAGISCGAIYLLDGDGRLTRRAQLSYPDPTAGVTGVPPEYAAVLRGVVDRGEPLELRLEEATGAPQAFLCGLGVRSVLLAPLALGPRRLGVLELASLRRELGADWLAFARVVGGQIGQALELARTLARLGASEQRYRDLVQGLDAIIWEAEVPSGRFTFVSPQAQALLGYPAQRWLDEPEFWANLIVPDDCGRVRAARAAALAEGRDHVLDYRVRAADGRLVWLHDKARVARGSPDAPGRDGDGRAVLRGVIVDLTEPKRAVEALRRHEALLRAVAEGTTDAIFVKDLEGRYLTINTAGAALLGKTVAEVLGKDDRQLFSPESAAAIMAGDRAIMEAGVPRTVVEVCTTAETTRTYLATKGPYKDAAGNTLGLVGIARDITDRARIEQQEAKMRVAQEIHRRLFPARPPALAGYDVAGVSHPAEATGGDYFDYIALPDGGLAVVVGDASGHGFGPALLMAETRAYLRALALTYTDCVALTELLNRALADGVTEDAFVTLFLGQLDPGARRLRYVSAGHPRAYVLRGGGDCFLDSTAPPLGIDPALPFPAGEETRLEDGDVVLVLTDGILEAEAPDGTAFGSERVCALVRLYRQDCARQIVENLYHAVRAFTQYTPQVDDITALVIKVGEVVC